MKNQACEPCAKRKVRCDRADPTCSNCKRRKTDRCQYPEPSSDERIKRLEEIIHTLGGDALLKRSSLTPVAVESASTPRSVTSHTPSVERSADRSIYLESQGWQAWINVTRGRKDVNPLGPTASAHQPAHQLPHAFSGSPLAQASDAVKLWAAFRDRVDPLIKLSYPWTLERLGLSLTSHEAYANMTSGEQALVIASCYFGAVSLSKAEYLREFGESRDAMLVIFRQYCEHSLINVNILAIADLESLKAICLYVKASVDRVSSQSLWSLMGLVCRSAELLGIHRDGELLGLPFFEAEERRRLWWQIQHIDLIMAVKNGSTPLTFMSDWDSELPKNLDDGELSRDDVPRKEKSGTTTFSFTLFTCWIMEQQRSFRRKHAGAQRSLLGPMTDAFINELEAGLQRNFLQYCDPIKPVDSMLQLAARAVICALRLRKMHEMRLCSAEMDSACRQRYFDLCTQEISYTVAAFTQPSLQPFHWMGEISLMWHASNVKQVISLLIDLPHINDSDQLAKAWKILGDLYTSAEFLSDFDIDKRRLRAAELVVAAWNTCATKPSLEGRPMPDWISKLLLDISKGGDEVILFAQRQDVESRTHTGDEIQTFSDLLNLDFADIEWSFWQ
ncbi:hypothetical protein NLG97_g213 [Lecanicillium saksenae]|uniref:Uncharacterized protein n=1 Tax=Lecanicillium saksenae TaxID=468837 RepID=A0ACC1RBC8_9HYPO|nr:hypothetical protein NLG97_g213 [Lecanicillium saksenae]